MAKALNMFPAPLLLVLLIITTPVILIFDGPVVHGMIIATAAVSLAVVALRIRSGEAGFLLSVVRPLAIAAIFPALWMLVQVLPLKVFGLANPIWESAAAALGRPLVGSISIDPGATLISFALYLAVVAIAFVASAVAVDRRHAEWILYALTAAATMIALMVLVPGISSLTFLNNSANGMANTSAANAAGVGVILAAVTALHTSEHQKRQQLTHSTSGVWLRLPFLTCLVAVVICSLAVFVSATSQTYFAVTCGMAILGVAIIIRRFHLGPWGYSAIVSVALVVAIAAVALQPNKRIVDLTLSFASRAPAAQIVLTQRILTETSWTGTGAGTFSAVLPIYRDVDELAAGSIAPTAAAAIAVEMGRPFLWAVLAAAVALVVTLLRGAVLRGRDSFYSLAGASCTVVITLLAFCNEGLLCTQALVTAAVVVGIAITQSKSRSI